MGNKKRWLLLGAVPLVAALAIWGNTTIGTTTYRIADDRIPEPFQGYRIVQLSDLHNTDFGQDNGRLLKKIREEKPDILVITGDMIDSRKPDVELALSFAQKAVDIAPCYYVPGNHEARMPSRYSRLRAGLLETGVTVLEDGGVTLERAGERIFLYGMADPAFGTRGAQSAPEGVYSILLTHRPERFADYVQQGWDLVFSGHAHGGQIRLPFVGGILAPNQGFFPQYDAGKFTQDGTTMVVSRGLGNSLFPLRVNNRPELVVAELVPGREPT